jgi:hypothetical protein
MPEETALRRTPLFDRHVEAGARIVPFAGWEMPVQYQGVIPEHLAVRTAAGVFDVSHMGQLELRGAGALAFAQRMLSNDLDRIGADHAQYTLLLDERGCPIDDLIAYRFADDHLLLVVNAARVDDDRDWLERHLGEDVALDDRSSQTAMLALQGPTALGLIELPQLVPFAISQFAVPIYITRATIVTLPVLYLLAAAFLARLAGRWCFALVSLAVLGSLGTQALYFQGRTKEQWREAAGTLDTRAQPGDVVLFDAGYGRRGFDYYSHAPSLRKIGLANDLTSPAGAAELAVLPFEEMTRR